MAKPSKGVPLPVGSDGRAGGPHAATNARRPAAASALAHYFLSPAARLAQLLLDRGAVDGLAVSGKRLLPRGDRVGEALLPESQLAEVVLHDGVLGQLRGGIAERLVGVSRFSLLQIGPTEAIEIGRIPRLQP